MDKRSWEEFCDAGLLWYVNRLLHLFGWSIVYEKDREGRVSVYPARTKYRGFDRDMEERGFKMVTEHFASNIPTLLDQVKDEADPNLP